MDQKIVSGLNPAVLLLTLVLLAMCVSRIQAQPQDQHPVVRYEYNDEIPSRTVLGNLIVDAALGRNYTERQLQFDFIGGTHKDYFEISNEGILKTKKFLDRDVVCRGVDTVCRVGLDVAIVRPSQYFMIIKVALTLLDVNDNSPIFTQPEITIQVSESALPGATFVLPSAEDPDSAEFGIQEYSFQGSRTEAFDLQVLENLDGSKDLRLVLIQRLNRERQSSYSLQVVARDGGIPPTSGTLDLQIEVVDANDNSPVFDSYIYNVSVPENQELYTAIAQVHANDPDSGRNGQVVYSFSSRTVVAHGGTFGINNQTGEIYLKQPLDYEEEDMYQLLVTANDLGPDAVPGNTKVIVHVQDVNDYVPQISVNSWTDTGLVEIAENLGPGEFVAHISVEDLDKGRSGEVDCEVLGNLFQLDYMYENTYKLVTKREFDREMQTDYIAMVTCEDRGDPPLSITEEIEVRVADENDHSPRFLETLYLGRVTEDSPIGTSVVQVSASDEDMGPNALITYHLHANSQNLLRVDPTTGVITTNTNFDYERIQEFDFFVLAMDQGHPKNSATATVRIYVEDINDEPPKFTQTSYTFGTFENQPKGTVIGPLSATDADSYPYNHFTFSLDSNDTFQINPETGVISTRKILDREQQSGYYLVARVANTMAPYLSSTASVTVYIADRNDNAPRIIFPTEGNDTIEVSARVPTGYILSRVIATDSDLGNNAKLTYSIAKGNEEQIFDIDPNNGAVSVQRDLTGSDIRDNHRILLMVQDMGEPRKSAAAHMLIHVNRTKAFVDWMDKHITLEDDPDSQSGILGYHQKILIILSGVTIVVVVILIMAIIYIKRRQVRGHPEQRDSYKYMSRMAGQQNGTGTEGEKKAVQFDLVQTGYMSTGMSAPLGGTKSKEKQNDLNRPQKSSAVGPPPPAYQHHPCPVHGQKSEGYVMSARDEHIDSDSTSGCSADMSNSDSGRGHSMEGEQHVIQGKARSVDKAPSHTLALECAARGGSATDSGNSSPSKSPAPHLPPRTTSLAAKRYQTFQPGCHGYPDQHNTPSNHGSKIRSKTSRNQGSALTNGGSATMPSSRGPFSHLASDPRGYTQQQQQQAPLQMTSFSKTSPYYRHEIKPKESSIVLPEAKTQAVSV